MAKRISKPVSLYIALIMIIYGYGITPFLPAIAVPRIQLLFAVAALPFNGSIEAFRGEDGGAPFLYVFVTLFLCIFTILSAIWAFTGQNEGRLAFLGFVSVNFLWWTFLVVTAIATVNEPERLVALILSLIRPIIWICCLWLYFTKKDLVAYYKQAVKT